MSMNKNSAEHYGSVKVYLTPEETPEAYKNRITRLKLAGFSERKARKTALQPIELDLYYEPYLGTFALNPEKEMTIYSPYTGIEIKKENEENEEEEQQIKIITPTGASKIDIAFAMKAKTDEIVRNGIIALVKQNNRHMPIPRKADGNLYALSMLDMEYKTFFFKSMSYNGGLITFAGNNEDDEEIDIDEQELPDNGLLYLYDYLTTGCY